MSSESPKQALAIQFAAVARALGNEHRLELIEQLGQGERSVEVLAGRCGLSVANASQHLLQLRRAGLVASRKEGKRVYMRLTDEAVVRLLMQLREVAERNVAEVQRVVAGHFKERDAMEALTRRELLTRLKQRSVTVLDVRPADEFAAGHLPNALNVPLPELARRLAELPKRREIVAYCRGPYCVLAYEAVALLRRRGFKARRLDSGYPEWRAEGLPVVTG